MSRSRATRDKTLGKAQEDRGSSSAGHGLRENNIGGVGGGLGMHLGVWSLCSALSDGGRAVENTRGDWPTYRADAARTGYTVESLPATLSLAWTFESPHAPRPAWPTRTRQRFDVAYQPVIVGQGLYRQLGRRQSLRFRHGPWPSALESFHGGTGPVRSGRLARSCPGRQRRRLPVLPRYGRRRSDLETAWWPAVGHALGQRPNGLPLAGAWRTGGGGRSGLLCSRHLAQRGSVRLCPRRRHRPCRLV